MRITEYYVSYKIPDPTKNNHVIKCKVGPFDDYEEAEEYMNEMKSNEGVFNCYVSFVERDDSRII